MMEYFYLFVYSFLDVYTALFSQLAQMPDACIRSPRVNRLFKLKLRFMVTRRKYPCKRLVKRTLFARYLHQWLKRTDTRGRPICFVLQYLWLAAGMGEYIKDKFPDAAIVCLLTDVVSSSRLYPQLLEDHRDCVDLIYSYDADDCARYGFLPYDTPCSDLSLLCEKQEKTVDVCFVGQDKGRLEEILAAYDYLTALGLRCEFHLVYVPDHKRRSGEGLYYHDGFMSYTQCLALSGRSRCILEIVQEGSTGNTIRVYEAIRLGCKLLSNNGCLVESRYYVPENMAVFQNIDRIPKEFFQKEPVDYPQELKQSMTPAAFLKQIQADLSRSK